MSSPSPEGGLRAELIQTLREQPSHLKGLEAASVQAEAMEKRLRVLWKKHGLKAISCATEEEEQILRVKQTCQALWPEHWQVLEACLACAVSLTMKNIEQGIALVLYGKSSDGKTTILEWLQGAKQTLWRTKITPAALTSGAGDVAKEQLEASAFVKTAKHKIVLVSDLNSMIKANDDRVSAGYSDFAIWLDGSGFVNEYGPHGTIGQHGDFTFVLLGAKTPMKQKLWEELAQLGMRLIYTRVNSFSGNVEEADFAPMRGVMAHVCSRYLDWFFDRHPLRSQEWPRASQDQLSRIRRAAKRVEIAQQRQPGHRQGGGHIRQRLAAIAHSRARMYGREALNDSDIFLAEELAASSSWSRRGHILRAIDSGVTDTEGLARAAQISPTRAHGLLTEMAKQGCLFSTLADPRSGRQEWRIKEEDELVE